MTNYKNNNFKTAVTIAKALADETRLRALMLLADGPLCLCQIVEILGLAPSTLSKHMSILQQAGLVTNRKKGRWMHFAWSGDGSPETRQALDWIKGTLGNDDQIGRDRQRLQEVLAIEPEQLCRKQNQN
ncbi:MAG: winged helix-turn-helix transcriptional regulator [Sedimentisphaerales bacterium]|nr:winged helix-turn-helix transcriptional regulator [Sedimentisphaerales bacterium]